MWLLSSKGFRDGLIMAAADAGLTAAHLVKTRNWIGGQGIKAFADADSLNEQKNTEGRVVRALEREVQGRDGRKDGVMS
jgi:hypothetical protein